MNAPTLPSWLTTAPPAVAFSIIPDVSGKSIERQTMQWNELANMLANPPTYTDKFDCPLIKLATFGDIATEKGALRHDGNVLTVTGVEGDYDGEVVPMSWAAEKLRAAGIAAVFYTSAHHTPEKPRWRVVCPLSASFMPTLREGFLASVDALLGNILASESYALSQTYFYGRVAGAPFESVVIDGAPFDTVLPAVDHVRRQTKAKGPTKTLPLPDDFAEVLEKIDPKGDYLTDWVPTVLGALNTFGEAAIPGLVEWSMPWYVATYPRQTAERLEAVATHEIGKRLQEEGIATWENVRDRASLPRIDVLPAFNGLPAPDVRAAVAAVAEWPELQPIPDVVLPAPAFDYTMLPEPLVAWVKDIATRKSWAPDYIAVSVMTLCGSLLGRKVAITPDDTDPTWTMIPNLWGLLIGTPSSAKSPSIEEALRLLKPVAAEAENQFKLKDKNYTNELKFHRAKIKALEAKRTKALSAENGEIDGRVIHDQITEMEDAFDLRRPKRRQFFTTDATYEALFSILVDNPQGTMLYKDEMSNLMAQMEMENFAMLRSFLLTAWKGNSQATKDRVKDEDNPLPVIEACISLLGGLQPALLPRFLGGSRDGSAGDDGFPQRFGLMVWPDDPPLVMNESPKDMVAEQIAADVVRRLEQWPMTDQSMTYSFDGPTQRSFHMWHSKLVSDNRTGVTDPALVTWLGKYVKTVVTLALITTLVEGRTVVDALAWGKAMKWEKHLRGHLERIIDYSTRRATQHAKNIIAKITKGAPGDNPILNMSDGIVYVTSRTLSNRQLPGCATAKETDDLLEWLEELGYVRFRGPGVVKSVKKLWEINPALFVSKG